MFSAVRKGAREREYESAIQWLEDAGLIHKCYVVGNKLTPLAHYAERSCFKVFPLDVGLLGAMAGARPKQSLDDHQFKEFKGTFTEAYVAQHLTANDVPLYYWRSKSGGAERDFMLSADAEPLPLEVKAGMNTKSKSLRSYDDQYAPRLLTRSTLLNLRYDGKILNIPL